MTTTKIAPSNIAVRSCRFVSEFQQMMELQKRVWNYSDLDVVPSHLFVVAAESGGQVLGAFLDEQLVGFTLAYAGEKGGKPYLHSHFAAVLPEYRDLGVGRELKMAQRREALERGINRIEWTFDPLQSRNAYFNICRLGAICRHYLPDLYGTTSSPLHAGLPTDRLLAEWWLDSPRVQDLLAGRKPVVPPSAESIPIPLEMAQLSASDATMLQAGIRKRFTELFESNYTVGWFERSDNGGAYVLASAWQSGV